MTPDKDERLRQVISVLEQLSDDTSVPKNIRKGANNARETLLKSSEPLDVRSASAVYILDELANDPNIPLHGRTQIWSIISQLETIK